MWAINAGWCLAGAVLAVVARLGGIIEFDDWAYLVAIPGGEQVVSWGDFLFAGAAFWLPSAAFLGLERARSDRSPTATIKSIRRMMAAIAIATVIGAGIYLAARPPNFPVSTPLLAGFFSILLIGGHQLVRLISSGRLAAEANHHPWLSKFSLLVLGSFVSILLFEGLLHIYNPIEYSVRGNDVVLPTNKRVILVNKTPVPGKTDAEVNISRNKLGLRGPEAPIDFADYLTLVTVGGSTTADRHLTNGKTWTDRMTTQLMPHFKKLWVNNGGFVGHSSYGHIRLLSGFLNKLKPKAAIFLIGINDLARDQGLESIKDHDSLIETNRNRIRPMLESLAVWSEVASILNNTERAFQAWRLGYSRTSVNGLHKIVGTQVLGANQPDNREAVIEKARRFQSAYRARIMRIIDLCDKAGIRPIFVTQPFLWGQNSDPTTGMNLSDRQESLFGLQINSLTYWEVLEQYNDTLRQVTATAKVPLVDLAKKLPKDTALYLDRMHFGNDGAEMVGRLVALHICTWLKRTFPLHAKPPLSTC